MLAMKIKYQSIKRYAQEIKKRFRPQKIILFGSYGYGRPTKDSDVDLLVINDAPRRGIEQAVAIRKELPSPFPLDLIVKSSKEVKKRIQEGDFFFKTILEEGRIL